MSRIVAAAVLAGLLLALSACSSSSSSMNEPKKLEGKRIPPQAGPSRGGPPTAPEQK
jgi:hypothetical protein